MEAEFRRAVQLDPLSVDAREHLGQCLWLLARFDAAIEQLTEGLRLDAASPRLRVWLGGVLNDKGDSEGPFGNT